MGTQEIAKAVDGLIREIDPAPWADVPALREGLAAFFSDNSGKTPDELAEIADKLYDGRSFHTAGYIVQSLVARYPLACPWLIAAAIYATWKGGKAGFQFLPDPATMELADYEHEVDEALVPFEMWGGFNGDDEWTPAHVLTGDDREFYDNLPDRFMVYRGGAGVPPDLLAAGLCWTISRPIAEWFARRAGMIKSDAPSIVLSQRIHKRSVILAFDSEMEIVTRGWRWHTVKCRLRTRPRWRPAMAWSEARGAQVGK